MPVRKEMRGLVSVRKGIILAEVVEQTRPCNQCGE